MLSHCNVLTVVAGQLAATNQIAAGYGETFSADDVMISYLPLAHIFDRCAPPGKLPRGPPLLTGAWVEGLVQRMHCCAIGFP